MWRERLRALNDTNSGDIDPAFHDPAFHCAPADGTTETIACAADMYRPIQDHAISVMCNAHCFDHGSTAVQSRTRSGSGREWLDFEWNVLNNEYILRRRWCS